VGGRFVCFEADRVERILLGNRDWRFIRIRPTVRYHGPTRSPSRCRPSSSKDCRRHPQPAVAAKKATINSAISGRNPTAGCAWKVLHSWVNHAGRTGFFRTLPDCTLRANSWSNQCKVPSRKHVRLPEANPLEVLVGKRDGLKTTLEASRESTASGRREPWPGTPCATRIQTTGIPAPLGAGYVTLAIHAKRGFCRRQWEIGPSVAGRVGARQRPRAPHQTGRAGFPHPAFPGSFTGRLSVSKGARSGSW